MDFSNLKHLYQKYYFYILTGACIIIGVTLLILPADYFDTGQAMCLSVLLLDTQCYGCGMTRAIQHLIHLDFEMAYDYNKLSFIVLPLFVVLIGIEILKAFRKLRENNNDK